MAQITLGIGNMEPSKLEKEKHAMQVNPHKMYNKFQKIKTKNQKSEWI